MNIDLGKIKINNDEVLRYLEYKGQTISEELRNTINKCIEFTKNEINPRYILRVYPIERKVKEDNNGNREYIVNILNTNLELKSKDIYILLDGCRECVIMAVTLGINIDKNIKKYSYSDLTSSIILDSCATTAIEEACDLIEDEIRNRFAKKEKYITKRYSPGYGDLSIEDNKSLVNILGAINSIGLTVTDSNIMIPRKSVTAIIGVSDYEKERCKKSCIDCKNYSECKYRKEVKNGEC